MQSDPDKPMRYGLTPTALVFWGPVIVIVAVSLLTKLLWWLVQ